MPDTLKGIKELFMDMIDERLAGVQGLDLYVVTGVNESTFTLNIKRMNINQSHDNVEMIGLGFGHGKGFMKLPNVDDVVLVGFVQASETPYILGTVFDVFSTKKDSRVDIKINELFGINQLNGAYFHFNASNDIIIRTPTGAKLKLLEAGGFKLYNKTNHGIDVDASGNMVVRAVTEDHTQSGGSF